MICRKIKEARPRQKLGDEQRIEKLSAGVKHVEGWDKHEMEEILFYFS